MSALTQELHQRALDLGIPSELNEIGSGLSVVQIGPMGPDKSMLIVSGIPSGGKASTRHKHLAHGYHKDYPADADRLKLKEVRWILEAWGSSHE